MSNSPLNGRGDSGGEDRIEVLRYLDAIRRDAWPIAAIVAVITGAVVSISLSIAPTYQAPAKIVLEESPAVVGQSDGESVQRRLATTRELLTAPRILDAAGKKLSADGKLGGSVVASVHGNASIIIVVGVAKVPERAAAIANAVSFAFLAERAELDRRLIAGARRAVQEQIDELATLPRNQPQIAALRERLSELSVAESAAGVDLQIAEEAQVPSKPSSPRPLRNGVLALFGSLFLGILFALAQDQLAPRRSTPRDLSRILRMPVLIGVPFTPRRRRPTRKARLLGEVEEESYQSLRANLEFSAWGGEDRMLLITGALPGEGKTSVTARLGRALARAGHKTLLISADLRVPKLHEQFELPLGVGLADILAMLDQDDESVLPPEVLERATNVVIASSPGSKRRSGCLHVITSGTPAKQPGRFISSNGMRVFLSQMRQEGYDYILVDGPPLLGLADSQVLARWTDTMLIVSRLDTITLEHASELREVLDRLEARALGLVVIGVEGEMSPYYLTTPPAVVNVEPETHA